MVADAWYDAQGLFEAATPRVGGLAEHTSRQLFAQASLKALTGNVLPEHERGPGDIITAAYPCLQLTLTGVDPLTISGLPDASELNAALVREVLVHVPAATFEFDAQLRIETNHYFSEGAVCVGLQLNTPRQRGDRRLRENQDQVDKASERGLIDDWHRDKANFRLQNRPLMRKLGAMADSNYVPVGETTIEVVFGYWHDAASGDYVQTPMVNGDQPGDFGGLDLRFCRRDRPRAFRMTDLFRSAHEK